MNELKVDEEELTILQKSIASLSTLTTLFLGIIVMIGWKFHSSWLLSTNNGLPIMSFNAALLFVISSLTLGALIMGWKKTVTFLSILIIVFAGGLIFQGIIGEDLGINNIFFTPSDDFQGRLGSQISNYTALCFVLFGLGILSINIKQFSVPYLWLPGVFASSILAVIAFGIYGYGRQFNPNAVIYLASYTVMGLILLYISMLLVATSLVRQKYSKITHGWVSILITLGIITIATVFYFSFSYEQKLAFDRESSYDGANLFQFVSSRISQVINTLNRTQARYQIIGSSFDKLWETDVNSFKNTLTGFRGLLLLQDNEKVLKQDITKDFPINEAFPVLLSALKRPHGKYFTIRTAIGRQIFVIQFPLPGNKTVVSLFDVNDLILIPRRAESLVKFDLLVLFNGILLCNTYMYSSLQEAQTYQLLSYTTEIGGLKFQAFLRPRVGVNSQPHDLLPALMLASGYLMGFFVGFLFFLLQKFKALSEQLNLANNAKTMFLSNVSHEIKTPIHGIMGTTTLLQTTELDPKQNRYLQIITASGRHLLSLVNNLLDLSKIELGNFSFTEERCNVKEVCKEALKMLSTKAKEKNLDIDFDFRQDPSINEVNIPVQALAQILTNLLGNAIKFTDRGKISLSVTVKEEGNHCVLNIIVQDTGIGIPADKHEVIYEKFSQVDEKESIVRGGTGLGLYLTKTLVEKLGGTISLESAVGLGTTFYVRIPIEKYSRT